MAGQRIQQQSADVMLLEVVAKDVVREALPAIGCKLSGLLRRDEATPHLAQFVEMVVHHVQRLHARLEEARHAEGCVDSALAESRGERDEAAEQVYGVLSELRDVLRLVSRRRAGEVPALIIPVVPQEPSPLLRAAERVLEELRGAGPLVPEDSPVRLDAAKTASELEQAVGALRRALPEVERYSAEAVLMQERREEAEAVFETDCARALRLLKALGAYGVRPGVPRPERAERVLAG